MSDTPEPLLCGDCAAAGADLCDCYRPTWRQRTRALLATLRR